MPELPEVETARRTLRPILGRRITAVEVLRPVAVRTHTAPALARALRGKRVERLERLGKSLVLRVDGHALRFHFKLWGAVRLHPRPPTPDRETALLLTFDDGSALEFRELQLSEIHLVRVRDHEVPGVEELGIDPLSRAFTRAAFEARLAGARGAVRTVLTDQARFAGIGNLWAHEILHRAALAPHRPVESLTDAERAALYEAVRSVVREAVRLGGEPDFVDARGRHGRFPLAVYGRAGQSCPRDGTPVRQGRLGGRPSFWCPACQR